MASFISLSSSTRFRQTRPLPPLRSFCTPPSFTRLKRYGSRRWLLLQVKCDSEQNADAEEAKLETASSPKPSSSSSSSSVSAKRSISTYNWSAALGGLGFLETSYLTYLKLTNSEAFCPAGAAGSCTDVLNSDYSVVFGVPLPFIGMVAYGLVAIVGLQLGGNFPIKISEADGRWILLVTTTSMAIASAYFLYILNTQFAGEPCFYCLASALLSVSLLLITLKDLGSQEILKVLGLQLCIASLVVSTLNSSYNNIVPVARSSLDEIPYFKTEISAHSSPLAIALAKHLHSVGAKLYGAFWCSHCQEQKEMFGQEAAEILDYVECFPDGYKKGTTMIKECTDIKLQGFPTWVINGEIHSGELEFSELAELTGVKLEDLAQSK